MVITMIKKIVIALIVLGLIVVGAIVLFGRGDSVPGVNQTNNPADESKSIDVESIGVDSVTTDKSGNLVYVLPNKMPRDNNSGQPIMWIE